MRILFLHPNTPDYLSAGLFHGLRSLLGKDCIDLPRFDCMYSPMQEAITKKIRGKGFSLYGLLPDVVDLAAERFFIWETTIQNFDWYIIADIWRQWSDVEKLLTLVDPRKIILIDPADSPRIFPWNNLSAFGSFPEKLKQARTIKRLKYFKREWKGSSAATDALRMIPLSARQKLLPKQIFPISFSFPAEKIIAPLAVKKSKLFAAHIVDKEVADKVSGSLYNPMGEQQYLFETEEAYYKDIQNSQFGITTKRSGWDCLRHYELAANTAVLCFKNLDRKEPTCAPHGLHKGNCIIYHDYQDLMEQIHRLDNNTYNDLQLQSYQWIQAHSSINIANNFLHTFNGSSHDTSS